MNSSSILSHHFVSVVWSSLSPVISFALSLIDVRVAASMCGVLALAITMGDKRHDRAIDTMIR